MKSNLILTDDKENTRNTTFEVPNHINSRIGFTGGIYTSKGSCYFNPPLTNNFYSLSDSIIGLTTYYVNFGKDSLPSSFISTNQLLSNLFDYSLLGKSMVKGDSFIGFNYVQKGGYLKQAFYNLQSGHIALSDSSDYLNSLFHYDVFQAHDTLFTTTYMKDLKKLALKAGQSKFRRIPGFYEKIMDHKSGENPVIIYYTLKSF